MEFITVKENPEFSQEVRQWTRKTIANGAEMAEDIGKLLSNDVYLKEHLEELDGNAVKDGEKGTAGGVATLDNNEKLVQHVEYDHVDNVPAPQWGGIENKPGSYPPSSHTHNKSEVGLGNVNNTADSDKRVAYAADADTVDGKHASAFATSSHTHSAATQSAAGLMSAADKKKLDGVASSANNYSHPTSAGNKHIPAGGSSGQILRWSADGTAAWGTDNNTTYSAATQSANGLMSAADKKKLDGIAASANNYSHPTSAGNKHIPAGGKSGQILRWSADGTAAWGADNNTTYGNMGGASASAAGKAGLVPAPAAGAQGKFLRGDGSWQVPTNTTYSAATQSANGLMSAADKKKLDGVATGANVTPSGLSSGYVRTGLKSGTTAGSNSTVEGYNNIVTGWCSYAEGQECVVTIDKGHAEGSTTKSTGGNSHAECCQTIASGLYSHAGGLGSESSGEASFAHGRNVNSTGYDQCAIGEWNDTTKTGLFVIGCGSSSEPKNIFRVTRSGIYGSCAFSSSGADYAEYFEWEDENIKNEDRVGYFVTLNGSKIKIASSTDDYILGIISGMASVIGNSDTDGWYKRYVRDEFGRFIRENHKTIIHESHTRYEDITFSDENGNEQIEHLPITDQEEVEIILQSYKSNPEYDPTKHYDFRKDRAEWDTVGMLGQIVVRDDGTCQVNGYCKVADGGIATASEVPGWRVIGRVNDHLIKIVFR